MTSLSKATDGKWPEWLNKTSGHLGTQYPFYQTEQTERFFSLRLKDVIERMPVEERSIDPVATIEMLLRGYCFANRTLVEGIERSPWLASPREDGSWNYAPLQPQGWRIADPKDVAMELRAALRKEILHYVSGKKTVGILLSGGLDSRIVAGLLRELQIDKDFTGEVIALTWGLDTSRDVVYAREIARRFNWEFIHFPLSPETMFENIFVAGEMGAETAPNNLHAMPAIRKLTGMDAIVAGSYGDTVGRSEFNGSRITDIKATIPKQLNPSGLIRNDVMERNYWHLKYDAYGYKKYYNQVLKQHNFEIERHYHHTRRYLSGAMGCIAEHIPLYQAFTAPETYKVTWGLDYKLRDDSIYAELLPTLPNDIGNIAWARSGKSITNSQGTDIPDEFTSVHHIYGRWLRRELRDEVKKLVQNSNIQNLNIFNHYALDAMLKIWPTSDARSIQWPDQELGWLASLSVFIDRYNVKSNLRKKDDPNDLIAAVKGISYNWTKHKIIKVLYA